MATVMLISKPKGTGAEFAGLPLKNLTNGTITLGDGREIPVDNDTFTNIVAGDEIIFEGQKYTVEKVSMLTPGMGKIVLMEQ